MDYYLFNRRIVLSTCFMAESALLGASMVLGAARSAALSAACGVDAPSCSVFSSAMI